MGIQGLTSYLYQRKQFIKTRFPYGDSSKKHIIIDMNNQIFPDLQKQKNNLTAEIKFNLIIKQCEKIISQTKDKQVYIVVDPVFKFNSKFSHSFQKEYSFLQNYKIQIKHNIISLYSKDNSLITTKMFTRNVAFKPKLLKKITNNSKKPSSSSIYYSSKYNLLLFQTIFKPFPNIHIKIANIEADYKIPQIVYDLIHNQHVDPNEILICSKDTDISSLCNNVDIQFGNNLLKANNLILNDLKYYYLLNTDYIKNRNTNIEKYLINPLTEQDRIKILQHACEHKNLNIIFLDMLHHYYNIIESDDLTQSLDFNISDINCVKDVFIIYEQTQSDLLNGNIINKDIIINLKYFSEVMSNKTINKNLNEIEQNIKKYYGNEINLIQFQQLINQF